MPCLQATLGGPLRPELRALAAARLEPRGSLASFADDLAAVFLNDVAGLGPLLDVTMLLPLATRRRLHIPNAAITNYGAHTDFGMKRRLHERIGSSALAVKLCGRRCTLSKGMPCV